MAQNRIAVYLLAQNPEHEVPAHHTTKKFAFLIVAARSARMLSPGSIQLTTRESWCAIKARLRPNPLEIVPVPKILPPRQPEMLLLSYPPVPHDANERARQAEIWRNATRF